MMRLMFDVVAAVVVAVIDVVASNGDSIGYIDSSKATDKVKVVATF